MSPAAGTDILVVYVIMHIYYVTHFKLKLPYISAPQILSTVKTLTELDLSDNR